jgi:GNAT superfamily N-acetyltransferase
VPNLAKPRTVTAADLPSVLLLLNAAYGQNPTFDARFRTYSALEPEGWVVVDGSSGPIGVGGFVAFGATAYIGLMAVSPDAQRRGVGAAIFEEVLARCEARGSGLLLLDASDAGAPLYEKYAFEDHGLSYSFSFGAKPGVGVSDSGSALRVESIDSADPKAVVEVTRFDAECFGADRSRLVRHCLHERAERSFAARDSEGTLVGYAMGQARSFGPCMARSPAIAASLARKVFALPSADSLLWLIAGQNENALALAESLGGVRARSWRHMRRGNGALLTSDWSSLFAKVSLAVG